jgi:hypothetical protein
MENPEKLGKLISVHMIAPAFLQRAVIVAVLAFLFFLVTMTMFSMWRNFLYFFLATAFLLVYLATMFGWLMLRKNILKIYENGLTYRKSTVRWSELERVETQTHNGKTTYRIHKAKGEPIVLSDALYELEKAVALIAARIKG